MTSRIERWRGAHRASSIIAAATIVAGLAALLFILEASGAGRSIIQSLVLGAFFGVALQRSRFCFLCHWRDFIEQRDPRGFVAILLALAVGTLGYAVLFAAWLPDPTTGRLPPDAHIGPAGPVLAFAAFVFGVGMAVSGSCVSGHLYRLGEGSPTAPFALLGAILGFALGFLTWNTLYVTSIATTPVLWFPADLGYPRWLLLQLGILAALVLAIGAYGRLPIGNRETSPDEPALRHALRRIFVDRWPATVGGAAVGIIATVAYFQVQPLGVTSALGSFGRWLAKSAGVLPETLHGLDGFAGCRTAAATFLTPNTVFVAALVLASFASALVAAQFKPAWPTRAQVIRGLAGGTLLGWGAMTALGCTVGTLLSGTIAGAASGWIFFSASFLGVFATLQLSRRLAAWRAERAILQKPRN
ncbi:MAG: YeeE/YedE family protein [Hyphomicrobium sp.]